MLVGITHVLPVYSNYSCHYFLLGNFNHFSKTYCHDFGLNSTVLIILLGKLDNCTTSCGILCSWLLCENHDFFVGDFNHFSDFYSFNIWIAKAVMIMLLDKLYIYTTYIVDNVYNSISCMRKN